MSKFSWNTISNLNADSLVGVAKDGVVLTNKDDPSALDYSSTVFSTLKTFTDFLEANKNTFIKLIGKDEWKLVNKGIGNIQTKSIAITIYNFAETAKEVMKSLETDQRNAGPEEPGFISSQTYLKISTLVVDGMSFIADCLSKIPGPIGATANAIGIGLNVIAIFQSYMGSRYDEDFRAASERLKAGFPDFAVSAEIVFSSSLTEKYKDMDCWNEVYPTVLWLMKKLDIEPNEGTEAAKHILQIINGCEQTTEPGIFTQGTLGREPLSLLSRLAAIYGLPPIEVPVTSDSFLNLTVDAMTALNLSGKIPDKSLSIHRLLKANFSEQDKAGLLAQVTTDCDADTLAIRYALVHGDDFYLGGNSQLYAELHNAQHELDMFDPVTGKGGLTETCLLNGILREL